MLIGSTNKRGNSVKVVKGDRYFVKVTSGYYLNHKIFHRVLVLIK